MKYNNQNYTAVLLAAGFGSRISSITQDPKSLLKINGETIIERHLRIWRKLGIKKATIVLGYKSDLIRKQIKQWEADFELKLLENSDFRSKGNTYSWMLGIESVSGPALIFDADLVYEEKILESFLKNSYESEILVGENTLDDIECTKALVDPANRVRKTVEKRKVSQEELALYRFVGEAMGILKFDEHTINAMRPEIKSFLSKKENILLNWEHFLNEFLLKYPVGYYLTHDKKWFEIDTPEDYEVAKTLFQNG